MLAMAWKNSHLLVVISLLTVLSGTLLVVLFAQNVDTFERMSFGTEVEHASISTQPEEVTDVTDITDDMPVEEPEHESPPVDVSQHPILVLTERAEAAFDEMLAGQSDTYEKAVTEYMRRYERSPPPGFKYWYEYAVEVNSPMIDDFDVLDAAISPLLRHSGASIQQQTTNARDSDSVTWSCNIHNQRLGPGCEGLSEPILRLFGDARILPHLPKVDLMFNGLDEPRVLLQQEPISRARRSANSIKWTDLGHHDVWDLVVTRQCEQHRDPLIHKGLHSRDDQVDSLGLPLVQDTFEAIDVCQHPEYQGLHAFFTSPASFKSTGAAVPILSPAVVSTMGDIPYPATAYNSGGYKFNEGDAVKWDEKVHALYWAGKTTGGQQKGEDEWKQFHRHRFISLTSDMEPRAFTYLQRDEESGDWQQVEREALNTTSYHAYFTDVVQCEEETCSSVREYFDIHKGDSSGETSKYTLNFDSDGNGHSGRYYRLLASYSLPLKQTIFREWHDDRLQPWVHYVPISLGMEELPEVVRYLVEEEEGRQLAEKLATKGREWTLRALRPVDQVVYMYRLMLELARVQDPRRQASK